MPCTPGQRVYGIFGLSIGSSIDLQELEESRLTASEPHAVDACIRLGRVPPELAGVRRLYKDFQIADGRALLGVPGIGRFLIQRGREIILDVVPGADHLDVRRALIGRALMALLHQRGLVPLHGSAVAVNGRPIGLIGVRGSGKSALLGHFRWRQCLPMVGATLILPFAAPDLIHLFVLRWLLPRGAAPEIEPLDTFTALKRLRAHVREEGLIAAMDREPQFLSIVGDLLSRVRCFELRRPMAEGPALEAQLQQIETLIRSAP
jgi:hypothetical protein